MESNVQDKRETSKQVDSNSTPAAEETNKIFYYSETKKLNSKDVKDSSTTPVKPSIRKQKRFTAISKKNTTARLERFKKALELLERELLYEFDDIINVDGAVKESKIILEDVSHNLNSIRKLIEERTEQLKDAEKRYKILTAGDLSHCTAQNLEDISDILWAGLQAATLALSKRKDLNQGGVTEADNDLPFDIDNIRLPAEEVPEATFFSIPTPEPLTEMGKAGSLCETLQRQLQIVKETQQKNVKEYGLILKKLTDLQTKITTINDEYGKERNELLRIELQLETRLQQVTRLTGRDSYDNLSTSQLNALCKMINKASRKLATEQAIREVRSQQRQTSESHFLSNNVQPTHDIARCLVCFERPWDCYVDPCKHTLCSQCAKCLKFCPQCRTLIEKIVNLQR